MISAWKIRRMEKLADEFKCQFYLPPFNKNISEAAFDIEDFKEKPEFQEFLAHIKSLDVAYEYAKQNDRFFLVVKVE